VGLRPTARTGAFSPHAAILECRALPLAAPRLPAAPLDALADRLADLGRLHRLFRPQQALQPTVDPEGVAVVAIPDRQHALAGVRVRRSGTVSVWAGLEGDALGHIVEAADLADRIAGMLRLAAGVVPTNSDVALAAAQGPTDQVVEESMMSDLGRRTQATLGVGLGGAHWHGPNPKTASPPRRGGRRRRRSDGNWPLGCCSDSAPVSPKGSPRYKFESSAWWR